MVLLEAMDFGKTIISTNVESINEVINKGTGILIKGYEYKTFINELVNLKDNRKLISFYSINAKRIVEEKFNIKKYIKYIENQLYKQIISRLGVYMKPLLTIFTPTYNRKDLLSRCYESLRKQTSNNFEWLIIDDGSTDGTIDYVDRWINERNKFNIRYIYQQNQGMHGAHNTAYENINTELNTCLDSDDYMADDAVEKICSFWIENGSGIGDTEMYRHLYELVDQSYMSDDYEIGVVYFIKFLKIFSSDSQFHFIIGSIFAERKL